tara:strand:- start:4367 stop:4597 length:231 start_codon:yes stop_codon:yes gene_type:complete
MKKLFFTLTLLFLVGAFSTPVYASGSKTAIELKLDDKKKKKKKKKKRRSKKSSCTTEKAACGSSQAKKSCCAKGKN